jgi:hypothetical protein
MGENPPIGLSASGPRETMGDRRHFIVACLGALAWTQSRSAPRSLEGDDLDRLGAFERVLGQPGVVVGVPHGTADSGTLEAGRILRERLNAGGVFVTGFWDNKTRQRINVNRPTEALIAEKSKIVRQWPSARAVAANARYEALVTEAAQGPLRMFYEMHSNHRADFAGSVEVSTAGISRREATRLKEAFAAACDRLERDVPRLKIHVSPVDNVTYPNYAFASSISRIAAKGCAIEHPGSVYDKRPWRVAYARCLAEAIIAAEWR